MITGIDNPWQTLYDPRRRLPALAKSLPSLGGHVLQVNSQYRRFLKTDITDIEELGRGEGGVLNVGTDKPLAVYRDEDGKVSAFSALCPHLKGVVCWNHSEKSWDCPVHGSRFDKGGEQICGPANVGLHSPDTKEKFTREMK